MTIARSRQISLQDTPYYHVVSRCVRRAFLCGDDAHSGQSYEHRRQWVVDKLGQLSRLFAIGICAYAVMSNHYHLVLKVEPDAAANWSEREVAERWSALFQWPLLVRRWYQGEMLIEPELAVVQQLLAQWRERLHSISWFIRLLKKILGHPPFCVRRNVTNLTLPPVDYSFQYAPLTCAGSNLSQFNRFWMAMVSQTKLVRRALE